MPDPSCGRCIRYRGPSEIQLVQRGQRVFPGRRTVTDSTPRLGSQESPGIRPSITICRIWELTRSRGMATRSITRGFCSAAAFWSSAFHSRRVRTIRAEISSCFAMADGLELRKDSRSFSAWAMTVSRQTLAPARLNRFRAASQILGGIHAGRRGLRPLFCGGFTR